MITGNAESRAAAVQPISFEDYVQAIWDDVLVPVCGASSHPQERQSFVFAHTEEPYPCHQYRFQDRYGAGGRLIMARDRRSCVVYPGDSSAESRGALQRLANMRLAALWKAMRAGEAR